MHAAHSQPDTRVLRNKDEGTVLHGGWVGFSVATVTVPRGGGG